MQPLGVLKPPLHPRLGRRHHQARHKEKCQARYLHASALSESASGSAAARFVAAGSNTTAGNKKKVLKSYKGKSCQAKWGRGRAVFTASNRVEIFICAFIAIPVASSWRQKCVFAVTAQRSAYIKRFKERISHLSKSSYVITKHFNK